LCGNRWSRIVGMKRNHRDTRTEMRAPPPKSDSVFTDLRSFFLHRAAIPTLVEFNSPEEREDYSNRILQRVGIRVEEYAILNIHRIGIDAPGRYVFEELLTWSADSPCWPNQVATLEPVEGKLEEIRVLLLGGLRRLHGWLRRVFGPNFGTLFRMDAVRFQRVPPPSDADNARYVLYDCHGGYPVGVLIVYARAPIADLGEREGTQLFFAVGFNIYGKRGWGGIRLVNRIWEGIHNRVTANVLNRFKQLCEARLDEMRDSIRGSSDQERASSPRPAPPRTSAATPQDRPSP